MKPFLALLLYVAASCSATVRYFNLELTWRKGSPDGYEREMIFINDQFPGPTLDIDQDDRVEIKVTNSMPFNTTLHWHGLEQINTPKADGVPGITQWSIQPGGTFTYQWHANQYGSYWYHSHNRGQIEDGAFGAIAIRPRRNLPNPFDKIDCDEVGWLKLAEAHSRPIIISDWRHRTSAQVHDDQIASGLETSLCMDSILVNGKGAVDCWPREDINQYTNKAVAHLLRAQNLTLTNKGCLPPTFFQAFHGAQAGIRLDVLPAQVYHECLPTTTPHEIIEVLKCQRWAAFDVISAASIHTLAFSVDEHSLWVYAVDGRYIEPLEVDSLTVSNGERYSVFVKLQKPIKNYGIRVAAIGESQLLDTVAVLSYKDLLSPHSLQPPTAKSSLAKTLRTTPSINRAGLAASPTITAFNQTHMSSFPNLFPQPPPPVAQTFKLIAGSVTNAYTFALNATPMDHSVLDGTSHPLLYQAPEPSIPGGNITLTTRNNTWVDLIFIIPALFAPPHPIHKHSNKAFALGAGEGNFTWASVADAAAAVPHNFNLVDPPLRDTFVTPPSMTKPTWLAVRYHVVNPGPFLVHCHIDSHLSGGMAAVILDGVDEWPEIPKSEQT